MAAAELPRWHTRALSYGDRAVDSRRLHTAAVGADGRGPAVVALLQRVGPTSPPGMGPALIGDERLPRPAGHAHARPVLHAAVVSARTDPGQRRPQRRSNDLAGRQEP